MGNERLPNLVSEECMNVDEDDVNALRRKLAQLNKRRQLLQSTRQEHRVLQERLHQHCHERLHQHELAVSEYRGWKLRRQQANAVLDDSQRWHILNDGFFIWHQGPFATINGVRLGSEAVVSSSGVPAKASGDDAPRMTTTALGVMGAAVSLPGRYLGFTAASTTGITEPIPSNSNHDSNNTATATTTERNGFASSAPNNNPTTTTVVKVPWTEINSALGQVVLLLKLLEQTPHSGISFPNHVLVPQGSTSKIGLRQPNAITGHNRTGAETPIVALYHLYSDDSFQLFGKRNFNLALRALTECLATTATCILARDRTLVLPFDMQVEHDNPSAPCTIGGLPVQYPTTQQQQNQQLQQDGVVWTRVMKYLLTNVKWCVAYCAKHVDR